MGVQTRGGRCRFGVNLVKKRKNVYIFAFFWVFFTFLVFSWCRFSCVASRNLSVELTVELTVDRWGVKIGSTKSGVEFFPKRPMKTSPSISPLMSPSISPLGGPSKCARVFCSSCHGSLRELRGSIFTGVVETRCAGVATRGVSLWCRL